MHVTYQEKTKQQTYVIKLKLSKFYQLQSMQTNTGGENYPMPNKTALSKSS
jgi:hypothetical protein